MGARTRSSRLTTLLGVLVVLLFTVSAMLVVRSYMQDSEPAQKKIVQQVTLIQPPPPPPPPPVQEPPPPPEMKEEVEQQEPDDMPEMPESMSTRRSATISVSMRMAVSAVMPSVQRRKAARFRGRRGCLHKGIVQLNCAICSTTASSG